MGGADDRLDSSLLGFGLLGGAKVFKAEVFVQFVEQFPPLLVEVYFDQAAFVVNGNRGVIFDSLGDVVDVDVVAKDFGGVFVGLLNGGACEADEGGIGQGITNVFGEAIAGLFADNVALSIFDVDLFGFEPVLAAVGFIG